MKNLKDEIEGKIIDILEDFEGERADEGVFVSPTAFPNAIEALTSLIEQEKERAVKKDRQAIHRDIVANDNITADEFFEQYLAERTK